MSKLVKRIDDILTKMKGKTFSYAKAIHCIVDYQIEEDQDKFTIVTNLNKFTRKMEAFETFIGYWEPANQMAVVDDRTAGDQGAAILQQENSMTDQLMGVLMDNIEKVRTDPAYIPQATAINNNVNSITNLIKLKLQFAREMKKVK